mgnify:CR=1 FL=1
MQVRETHEYLSEPEAPPGVDAMTGHALGKSLVEGFAMVPQARERLGLAETSEYADAGVRDDKLEDTRGGAKRDDSRIGSV